MHAFVFRYKPLAIHSPLLAGVEEGALTKLCVLMRPYLAFKGDKIVVEDDVGEEIFMVVSGMVKLRSKAFPLYNDRNWGDGAFFGEQPVLKIGQVYLALLSQTELCVTMCMHVCTTSLSCY